MRLHIDNWLSVTAACLAKRSHVVVARTPIMLQRTSADRTAQPLVTTPLWRRTCVRRTLR